MRHNKWYNAAVVAVLALAVAAVLGARKPAPDAPVAEVPAVEVAADLPRMVELGADKCVPCKMMAPIIEELKREQAGKIQVEFIDVWKDPGAGTKYGIKVIPTQVFFDAAGREILRHEGFFPKEEILGVFRQHGIAVAEPAPAAGG